MLILAHADGLRIDLHQLCQRILQAPGDGDRPPQRDVHIGKFLRRQLRCGVDRCPGFGDHDGRRTLAASLLEQVSNLVCKFFRFPRRSAIADGHKVNRVPRAQRGQGLHRLRPLVLRLVRIDNGGIEHLARFIHHGTLGAVAVARIEADRRALARRGSKQHVAQVRGKDLEGAFFCYFFQAHAHIQAGGNIQFGAPSPVHSVIQPRGAAIQTEAIRNEVLVVGIVTGIQVQLQHSLVLPAQERQNAVGRKRRKRLVEVEVILELRALGFLPLYHLRLHGTLVKHALAHATDQVCIECEAINEDGARTLERLLGIGKTFREIVLRQFLRLGLRLRDQCIGQLFQAGFARDIRLCLSPLFIRQVQILKPRLGIAGKDLAAQVIAKLALLINGGKDRLFALF